jgi:acyl-CoA synthetase (NDP forming)
MSIENLDTIFLSKSIAVVGASDRKGRVEFALIRKVIKFNPQPQSVTLAR